MRALLVTVALLLTALTAPAHADEQEQLPWSSTIEFPLYRKAANVDGDALVQLEAPPAAFGLRRWAKQLDAQVDGLTIFTTGTCASRPEAVCVRYVFGTWSPAEQIAIAGTVWGGVTTFPSPDERTVLIVKVGPQRRPAVAHELGHVLGLSHHSGKGVMSVDRVPTTEINAQELQALRDWFAVPRFAPTA